MIFDKLYFVGPMDLGDHFVHAGIINYYADRCNELHVPVKPHNYDTVSTLFWENSNVRVVVLNENEDDYVRRNNLGRINNWWPMFFTDINNRRTSLMWEEQCYLHYEVPFRNRYDNFRLPKNIPRSDYLFDKLTNKKPYALVHRITGLHPLGLPINVPLYRQMNSLPEIDLIEIVPGLTNNMLDFVKLIENADEIHCVNSSFFCLVDSIHKRTKMQLFFHDIRADSIVRVNNEYNKNCWTKVFYNEKL